jgi:dynein heavy chain, axonemal
LKDDYDQLLCQAYADLYMQEELLTGMQMVPFSPNKDGGFVSPSPQISASSYARYIDERLNLKNAEILGLHSNAEISRNLQNTGDVLQCIVQCGGADFSGSSATNLSEEELVVQIQNMLDVFKDASFDLEKIRPPLEPLGPFQSVFLRECETMNLLIVKICDDLNNLTRALKGTFQLSTELDSLKRFLI